MSKKLHVLFLSGWFPSRVLPNNGDFIQRHAEAVSLLHNVGVLHIISDKNCKEKIEYSFEKINGIDTHIAYLKPTKNPLIKGLRFFKAFKNLLKSLHTFDLIHLNILYPFGFFALYLKWFQKKPFIISEHWTGYHKPQSKSISFLEKFISKIIVKNASFVCTVSNDLKKSMLELDLKGNYFRVPNVVNTSIFKPKEISNTNQFNIIHISSMIDKHKNISGMLEVAKELENKIGEFTWQFIGNNNKEYIRKINELNFTKAKIEFIEHIAQTKLTHYLQNANVFVLFSNYENLPCVILESFSCGTPVISTNVGGIKEYFPENFGKLIEEKNKPQLLDALIKHKNLKVNKQEMHNFVLSNFSKKIIAENFSKLYYKSLKSKA